MVDVMSWLTATEWLYHMTTNTFRLSWSKYPLFSWCMTHHQTCNRSSTTGGNSAAGTVYHSRKRAFTSLVFSGVRFQSLVSCVICYRSVFVALSFFFWQLYCLSTFELLYLIIPLVYSNFSYFPMTCEKVICVNVIDIPTDIGII